MWQLQNGIRIEGPNSVFEVIWLKALKLKQGRNVIGNVSFVLRCFKVALLLHIRCIAQVFRRHESKLHI